MGDVLLFLGGVSNGLCGVVHELGASHRLSEEMIYVFGGVVEVYGEVDEDRVGGLAQLRVVRERLTRWSSGAGWTARPRKTKGVFDRPGVLQLVQYRLLPLLHADHGPCRHHIRHLVP